MSEPKNIYDKVDSVESKMDSMSSKIDGLTLQVQNLLSSDIKKQTQKFPLDKTTNIECSQASKQNIVRKFIASAKKEYIWLGSNQDFSKEQRIAKVLMLVYFVLGLMATILTSIAIKFYSLFTLFENVWMCMFALLFLPLVRTKPIYECQKMSAAKCFQFVHDSDGVLRMGALKKSYKNVFVLSCISAVLNCIAIIAIGQKTIAVVSVILELVMAVIGGFAAYKVLDFYCGYGPLRFSGKSEFTNQDIVFIFEPSLNKIFTEEDYKKTFPW